MLKFILTDYVALLSFVLIVGSVFLLILVIRTISSSKVLEQDQEEDMDVDKTVQIKNDTGLSLIEAHLNVLSEDIKEIKSKLDKLIEISETKTQPSPENLQLLKDHLSRISTKLDAMYNVLSDLVKE